MKLKVPFYQQTSKLNCGPTALRMAFDYLGSSKDLKLIEEKTGISEGKAVSTINLAITARELGFNVDFYSKQLYFNEEHLKKDFYKQHADITSMNESIKIVNKAREIGVNLHEETMTLDELLNKVNEKSAIIALIDWSVISGKNGYQGHFVPIIGYDKENVYIHNQSLTNPQESMKITRDLFDKARIADGTDEDLVIIYL